MKTIVRSVAAAVVLVAALWAQVMQPVLPEASAEPRGHGVPGSNVTPPIVWPELGLPDRLELIGANQTTGVSVPVPSGVKPTTLTGQIGSVVNVNQGRIEVLDGRGIVLGTIPVPGDLATVPFRVDISAAEIKDGQAQLNFVLRDKSAATDSCSQPPALALSQLAAAFSGPTPDPRTVADFLPGYLDQVLIRVGSAPTESQQQAALDLVAELTQLYRPMPVRIEVDNSGGPVPPGRSIARRVIDIRDGGTAGLKVEKPGTPDAVLAITGTGQELVQQVDLFADRRFSLAQTPSAATLSALEDRSKATNIKTFAQLGMTGEASVLGTSTLYAGFDVSKFAVGPISHAKVHLKAKYTPVVGGEASVLIRSGSTVLATHVLDDSGVLDVTGDIPPESITSTIGMAMELRYTPRQECAPVNDRMTFALDPQSTVTVTPGTHNRGGFPILPMAFTPDFDVAIDSPEHLTYAAQAINLMGQQTTVALRPRLTTFAAAATSGTGLLAVTGGSELADAAMNPPIQPGAPNTVSFNASPDTDLDLGGPLGLVQAFTHNGRTVLAISGSGDWSLVGDALNYIRGLENRWASLTGDVVATGAERQTVNLTVREGGGLVNEYPGDHWKWWAWVSLAAGAAIVIAAVTLIVVRRRRRTQ
ncbi:hypothetical protein AAHH97_21760 [Mycolicibacterium elephantis]|uniref:hypothetical protein n=1 Tax=Mycolicibacterium elephantis TaxID=81858 RepID=UPI003A8A85F3